MNEEKLPQSMQDLIDLDPKKPLLERSILEGNIEDSLRSIASEIQNLLGKYALQEGRFQVDIGKAFKKIHDHTQYGSVFPNKSAYITAKIELTNQLWGIPHIHDALVPYLEKRSELKSHLWKLRKRAEKISDN